MAQEIRLRIVTPRALLLDENVLEVTAPGTVGEFGVLPEHASFLSSLEIGCLAYRDSGGARRFAVKAGFAEVSDDVMTVLVDDARPGTDVDTTEARELLRASEDLLAHLSPLDPEYDAADAERRWAEALLAAASAK